MKFTDDNWLDGLALHAYSLKDGQSVSVIIPNHDGTPALTGTVTCTGDTVTAEGFREKLRYSEDEPRKNTWTSP